MTIAGAHVGGSGTGAYRKHQKIPRFDGRVEWEAYRAQFEILAHANGWDDEEKAYFLSTSLDGPAMALLANISETDRINYNRLTTALENRFGSRHQQQQSRVRLANMKRQRGETIPELLERVEKNVRLGYAETDRNMKHMLTLHHLTCAVDERMQAELMRRKPNTVIEAMEILSTEEAIRDCSRQRYIAPVRTVTEPDAERDCGDSQSTSLEDGIDTLATAVAKALQANHLETAGGDQQQQGQNQSRKTRKQLPNGRVQFSGECWHCQGRGHIRRNCPTLNANKLNPRSTTEGQSENSRLPDSEGAVRQ